MITISDSSGWDKNEKGKKGKCMVKQVLKTKRGKWAVALAVIAIIGGIGSADALPGAAVLLIVAAVLTLSAIKSIKNPPPEPTLAELGIYVPEDALSAFDESGVLPNLVGTPVLLNPGEQAVYDCSAVRTETKTRVVGHNRNKSASIRVAKGVSVRTGGGDRSVYGDVKTSSSGRFVVTTEKIVFSSQQKAFSAPVADITSVEAYDGGMTIISGKNVYVMELAKSNYPAAMIEQCRAKVQ